MKFKSGKSLGADELVNVTGGQNIEYINFMLFHPEIFDQSDRINFIPKGSGGNNSGTKPHGGISFNPFPSDPGAPSEDGCTCSQTGKHCWKRMEGGYYKCEFCNCSGIVKA